MSERPKWMPSARGINHAIRGLDQDPQEAVANLIQASGLRAQLAVLEELRGHMRARYATERNPTGSYCNEESLWIGDKIAALRKELEG